MSQKEYKDLFINKKPTIMGIDYTVGILVVIDFIFCITWFIFLQDLIIPIILMVIGIALLIVTTIKIYNISLYALLNIIFKFKSRYKVEALFNERYSKYLRNIKLLDEGILLKSYSTSVNPYYFYVYKCLSEGVGLLESVDKNVDIWSSSLNSIAKLPYLISFGIIIDRRKVNTYEDKSESIMGDINNLYKNMNYKLDYYITPIFKAPSSNSAKIIYNHPGYQAAINSKSTIEKILKDNTVDNVEEFYLNTYLDENVPVTSKEYDTMFCHREYRSQTYVLKNMLFSFRADILQTLLHIPYNYRIAMWYTPKTLEQSIKDTESKRRSERFSRDAKRIGAVSDIADSMVIDKVDETTAKVAQGNHIYDLNLTITVDIPDSIDHFYIETYTPLSFQPVNYVQAMGYYSTFPLGIIPHMIRKV